MLRKFRTVICIIKEADRILILRRSAKSRTNPGKWSGVAGEVEAGSTPEETVFKEIEEETGIPRNAVRLVHRGSSLLLKRDDAEVVVEPFLCEIDEASIQLNWEHTEYAWVKPSSLSDYETVPRFDDVLRALKLL